MAKEKTHTYVVIAPGVTTVPGQRKAHKIGDPVELTEKQAAGRVNKVRLKSEADKLAGGGKDIDAALLKRATEAEASLSAVQAKYDTGIKEIKELTAQVANAGGGSASSGESAGRITELEGIIASMEKAATEGGAKISGLEGQLADMNSKIESAASKSPSGAAKKKIKDLDAKVADLETVNAQLTKDLDEATAA